MLLSKYSDRYYQFILFLAIFQSCGIRLFQGVGITLSIVLFGLLIRKCCISTKTLLLSCICVPFLLLKGSPVAFVINIWTIIVNATMLVQVYQKRSFVDDLYKVLNFFYVHGCMTFILILITPKSLWLTMTSGATIPTITLGYLFYAPATGSLVGNIPKLMGLAWEPGCFQMLLNILVFLKIYRRDSLKSIIAVAGCIVLTGSTAGYLVMVVNLLYYFKCNSFNTLSKTIWFLIPLIILAYPFIEANISDKMIAGDNGINPSGIIRYRDLITGVICLKEHPLLGIDISDLASNPVYQNIEYKSIAYVTEPRGWYQYFEYACGGFTNGFFYTTLLWGVMGVFLIYGFLTNNIWKKNFGKHWYYIPLIISLSMISEPISNTIFFYFLSLSNFISYKKRLCLYQ